MTGISLGHLAIVAGLVALALGCGGALIGYMIGFDKGEREEQEWCRANHMTPAEPVPLEERRLETRPLALAPPPLVEQRLDTRPYEPAVTYPMPLALQPLPAGGRHRAPPWTGTNPAYPYDGPTGPLSRDEIHTLILPYITPGTALAALTEAPAAADSEPRGGVPSPAAAELAIRQHGDRIVLEVQELARAADERIRRLIHGDDADPGGYLALPRNHHRARPRRRHHVDRRLRPDMGTGTAIQPGNGAPK
jgi:hypothetical protein